VSGATHATRTRAIVAALALVAAIVGASVGVVRFWPHHAPAVAPGLVPASWQAFRKSAGHRVHVEGGKAECKDCHDYARDGFKNPGSAPCARCHAKEASHLAGLAVGGSAHAGNAETRTGCLTCHVFAPDETPPTCIGCHARDQGHAAAVHVHATADCASCHRVHEAPSIVPRDCAGCHDERVTEHASAAHAAHDDGRATGDNGCLDCHTGHAPAAAAVTVCAGCHAEAAGPKPAGHESCLGCHRPHVFTAGADVCAGCHAPRPTLVASQVHAHAVCISCHEPHAPMEAAASCSHCHTGIQVVHGGHEACVECHEPHGKEADKKLVDACTSCHKSVAVSDTRAHAGGVACQACHKPHDFTPPDRRTLCVGCHAREVTLAATSKGHGDCSSCHGASTHAPAKAPACGTCHANEASSAPPGHQKCISCHEPHAGSVPPRTVCTSCHANKAAGPHAAVPGGCATCHRAHGPHGVATPPACTTCHAHDRLPALHAVPAHADCATCHSSHDPPRADRAACTSTCHVDRRGHQPQAPVCSGCHVFRSAAHAGPVL
jgi:hypothetical protein